MKAVFLIIDYVPHQVLAIKSLIATCDAQVKAYHVGRFNTHIPELNQFNTTAYNSLTKQEIFSQIVNYNPDLVVVAGWMIPEYVWVAKKLKKKLQVPIVGYSDTPWYGTILQRINAFISPFHVKKAFSHIWVAGIYQFEYARRLGFKKANIIFNSLSADTRLFESIDIQKKNLNYPKNLLYIGRFSEEKGLHYLVKAWEEIQDKKGWNLTLIGDGHLKESFKNNKGLVIKDYMSQDLLLEELQNSGCFILPSTHEPWALVLHEAAVAGLPIICTNVCGAAPHFVLNGYNGKVVSPHSSNSLKKAIEEIISLDDHQLIKFSDRSRKLGQAIDSEISIQSLINLIA
jgi:glycosyltransferase involved in cell wall biosynthesis